MMPPQRARGAESRVGNKLSNGPRRAQSKAFAGRVFCDVWAYVNCRGYDGILLRARPYRRESRWHRGSFGFALDRRRICWGRFVLSPAAGIRGALYGTADETMAKAADDLT